MNKDQLIYVLTGTEDRELGRRFIEIEKASGNGYYVKDFKPLFTDPAGITTVMFLLEKTEEF